MTTKVSIMPNKPTNLYKVIRQIRPAFKHIAKSVEIRSKAAGLSVGQRAVLEQLCERGSQTVPNLAQNISVERQYIQRNVNDLLQQHFVRRTTNPHHKRSWLLHVTPEGETAFKKLKSAEMETLSAISSQLSESEISAALKVMTTLASSFEELDQRPYLPKRNSPK